MSIVQEMFRAIAERDAEKDAAGADFTVPEHEHEPLYGIDVCTVCGRLLKFATVSTGNFQDPFPSLGSDEYLTW